ncbi:MAG: alpha amylase C-terminal domain-containing protein, partial [Burkholderiales bacterium]|nr:alpha amylase C-terminal domain-containing protein [Burkholderiales bacterium]
IAQWREWHHERSLDWELTQEAEHAGLQGWVRDLNRAYTQRPELHGLDFSQAGFEWVDNHDNDASVITFLRKSGDGAPVLVACNFTPVVRQGYRVGVPLGGAWLETLNSDAPFYGGSGVGNMGRVMAGDTPCHGRSHSVRLTLPPLAIVVLEPEGAG